MRFRAYDGKGAVVATGNAPRGKAEFHADETVARVVFYKGSKAEEVVAGEVELPTPKSGKISTELEAE